MRHPRDFSRGVTDQSIYVDEDEQTNEPTDGNFYSNAHLRKRMNVLTVGGDIESEPSFPEYYFWRFPRPSLANGKKRITNLNSPQRPNVQSLESKDLHPFSPSKRKKNGCLLSNKEKA